MSSRVTRALTFPAVLGVVLVFISSRAAASERHFTYTYESAVLNPGDVELEPWTTFRSGRSDFYSRFDERLEFEFGLVEGLQTALYWNFSAAAADVEDPTTGTTTRVNQFEFSGVSSEWKYQLSNPVADVLGSALYLEGTLAPIEAELEAKLILDKRMGPILGAVNLVGEYEWGFPAPDETVRELVLELDLAGAYFVTDEFSVGLEARNVNEFEHAEHLESSVLYLGPAAAVTRGNWWGALSVMPQIAAFKGKSQGSRLDLEHQERAQVRVILGFHL